MYQSPTRYVARAKDVLAHGKDNESASLYVYNQLESKTGKYVRSYKAGIQEFFPNQSDRTAIPHPNFLRTESNSSAATKPGYQNRKPRNVGTGHRSKENVREYKRHSYIVGDASLYFQSIGIETNL